VIYNLIPNALDIFTEKEKELVDGQNEIFSSGAIFMHYAVVHIHDIANHNNVLDLKIE